MHTIESLRGTRAIVYADAAARVLSSAGLTGRYALDVATGRKALSGADLRGKARRYGAWYARRRASVLGVLQAAGIAVEARAAHNRRVLVLGPALAGLAI